MNHESPLDILSAAEQSPWTDYHDLGPQILHWLACEDMTAGQLLLELSVTNDDITIQRLAFVLGTMDRQGLIEMRTHPVDFQKADLSATFEGLAWVREGSDGG